jgi:aminopeptidase N
MKKFFLLVVFLILVANLATAEAEQKLPVYNLSVSFDLQKHQVKGKSKITLFDDREVRIAFGPLEIHSVSLNGQNLMNQITGESLQVQGKGVLEIAFSGKYSSEGSKDLPRDYALIPQNSIQKEHILLIEEWYPSIDNLAYYHLKASVPKNFTAFSESEEVVTQESGEEVEYRFHFPKPINRISFLAGPYREYKTSYNGTELFMYSVKRPVADSEALMKEAKDYVKHYEQYLGKYPYKRLSFIENFTSGQRALPTLILLDMGEKAFSPELQQSIKKLLLHQWFGGYVYIEKQEGNWASGLTSYLVDFLDARWNEEGWKSRKEIMIAFNDYADRDGEFILRDFQKITDRASRLIGCGKGMMLFHMLNMHIGKESFQHGLHNFIQNNKSNNASWDNLRGAFEETTGMDLVWFFKQWLSREGRVSFQIKNQRVTVVEGVPTVFFDVIQNPNPYTFELLTKSLIP